MFERNKADALTIVARHEHRTGFLEHRDKVNAVLDNVFQTTFAGIPADERAGAEAMFLAIAKAVSKIEYAPILKE